MPGETYGLCYFQDLTQRRTQDTAEHGAKRESSWSKKGPRVSSVATVLCTGQQVCTRGSESQGILSRNQIECEANA